MVKVGSKPYLECSSKGDKRFSTFYARPKSLNGKSIEEAYQAAKVFEDGSAGLHWKKAKGKKPINIEECRKLYKQWWKEWVKQEGLVGTLLKQSGLSDIFGQEGSVCQAEVLWEIRQEALRE